MAAKCVDKVDRNESRCCVNAQLELLCCTASISNLSMACFIFSICLLRMAFCSSSSVACFLNCRSSPSLAKILTKCYLLLNKSYLQIQLNMSAFYENSCTDKQVL